MKRGILTGSILLLLLSTFSLQLFSQSVTGIWRGYFISESGDEYKLEFQVKQGASYAVSGVSYSYLDIRFYGKATMTGTYIQSSQIFRVRETRTVEVKSATGGGTCIMNYDLEYSQSGKEEFLEGTYLGRPEVKDQENPYDWGDCGGGKVYLRKVATSNFYVEPFLRNDPSLTRAKPSLPTNPPVTKNTDAAKADTKRTTIQPKTNLATPQNNRTEKSFKKDTLIAIPEKEIVKGPPVVINPVELPPPAVIKNRQNELMKAFTITSPEITVKLYDNGEIDNDTISVYLDNKLVLSNKKLTTSPLTIKLKMDESQPDHELIMVAENLGRIPPNTSLMIVEAGEKRYEVRITSTEQKNAVVRFHYQKE